MKPLVLVLVMSYFHGTISGVSVHQVTIDLSDKNHFLTVRLARGGIGHGESFGEMVKRLKPIAAITGNFYDTVSLKPVGDIVLNGQVLYDGHLGPALIVSAQDGSTRIVSAEEYKQIPKSSLRVGMQTGPTLICKGVVACKPATEGFHIARTATRTAVGLTADNKLIMVATDVPITLEKLAEVMLKSECVDAVALDGGSSTGIYCEGKVKVRPPRVMTSLLVVLPRI